MTQPSDEILLQAQELLRAKQKQEAQTLLAQYLQQNPHSEYAWWLMSFAVTNPDQQIECLERVLQLNPLRHKARAKLDALTGEKQSLAPTTERSRKLQEPHCHKQSTDLQSGRWIPVIMVAILITAGLTLYFGYRIFAEPQVALPEQAQIPQISQSSPTRQNLGLPPTWTQTPTEVPTIISTSTDTPIPTHSPTPDPNATRTPIPESLVGVQEGKYPPEFSLNDVVTGEEISIRNYAGQPILAVFLTTWCGYCKAQMPLTQSFYDYYRAQGFVVLGIGVGANSSAMRNYGSQNGLTFPILADTNLRVSRDYAIKAYPTNFYIDVDGKIGFVEVGMISKAKLNFFIFQSLDLGE